MSLMTATSAFGLDRRRHQSSQQFYLQRLRVHYNDVLSKKAKPYFGNSVLCIPDFAILQ